MPTPTKLSVYYSPDSDDALMFYALQHQLIENRFEWSFATAHTQALNELAMQKVFDVGAISLAAYAQVFQDYQILRHGASVGRNYGPVLVCPKEKQAAVLEKLKHQTEQVRIAVPGTHTTARHVLKIILGEFQEINIPIEPWQAVFEALQREEVEAALLIHEGRLIYPAYQQVLLLDIGQWWHEKTASPLPLGINVISRKLHPLIPELDQVLANSIEWGLQHKKELSQVFSSHKNMSSENIETYLSWYANQDTLEMPADVIQGIHKFFELSLKRGLIEKIPPLDIFFPKAHI